MGKTPGYLRVIDGGSSHENRPPETKVAVILSISEIKVAVPWYLLPIARFIKNPYHIVLQEYSDEYKNPLDVETWTCQCNSIDELRGYILMIKNGARGRGRVAVVSYSNTLDHLVLEMNGT